MTLFCSWRAAHRRRLADAGSQSGFAMFVALLLIMVVAGMSVLVAGLVLSENKPVQTARKEVATVNASEAGFEIALTQLRAANNPAYPGTGDVTKLPCTTSTAPGTPITGSVGPNTGAAQAAVLKYRVYVRYYQDDPTTLGASDLSTAAISCSNNQPTQVPKFAYLTSNGIGTVGATGTSSQNNRQLHTTYQFKTSNVNFAGGRLNVNGTSLCMDSGTSPDVNSPVTISACQNRGVLPSQSSWAYRADLTIYLTTSQDPGLCVTAGTSFGTTTSALLTLQTCATLGTGVSTYPYQASPSLQQRQEWSFDDSGKFEGASNTGTTNGNCIAANPYTTPVAGGSLYEQGCSGGTFDTMTWNPDAQVGAGPAGDNTQQLVNYYEFGRCLDVTGTNVNASNLITYPCKQAPNPANILWNQRWAYNTTTKQIITTPNSNYCLEGPTTLGAVFTSNLVLTKACNTGVATQTWTERGQVVGDYGSSYTIVNNLGACLSLGPSLLSGYNNQWSTIIVETCDGSLKQKWNAPANFVDSRFKGTGEDQGGKP